LFGDISIVGNLLTDQVYGSGCKSFAAESWPMEIDGRILNVLPLVFVTATSTPSNIETCVKLLFDSVVVHWIILFQETKKCFKNVTVCLQLRDSNIFDRKIAIH
jgi:hypothetical protein